jgi:hypothetical protein
MTKTIVSYFYKIVNDPIDKDSNILDYIDIELRYKINRKILELYANEESNAQIPIAIIDFKYINDNYGKDIEEDFSDENGDVNKNIYEYIFPYTSSRLSINYTLSKKSEQLKSLELFFAENEFFEEAQITLNLQKS